MRKFLIIVLALCTLGCANKKGLEIKPEVIAYRLPSNVELLLLKQIEEYPKDNYCLLLEGTNDLIKIYLVESYSYYHKNTSYHALIGEKYYPISFYLFDMRFGITENAEEVLQRKIHNKRSGDFLTKKSYPLYHNMYKIELDSERNIVFEGWVY